MKEKEGASEKGRGRRGGDEGMRGYREGRRRDAGDIKNADEKEEEQSRGMTETLKANEGNQKKDSELPVGSILKDAHSLIMLLLLYLCSANSKAGSRIPS